MADHSSETKPRQAAAEYYTVETPAPNGAARPLGVKVIEAAPGQAVPVKDPSDVVIEAAGKVYSALATRIAYHEKQLVRLREALAPFAAAAVQRGRTQEATADSDLLAKLLTLGKELHDQETGT